MRTVVIGRLGLAVLFFLNCTGCRAFIIGEKQDIYVGTSNREDCRIEKVDGDYVVSGQTYSNPDLTYYYDDCGCPELAKKQERMAIAHSFSYLWVLASASVLFYQAIAAIPPMFGTYTQQHSGNYSDTTVLVSAGALLVAFGWSYYYAEKTDSYLEEFKKCSKGYQ